VQFLVIHQRAGLRDYGIEGAGSPTSETATPRTDPLIYNMTMIGQPTGGKAAINFKQGTRGKIYNSNRHQLEDEHRRLRRRDR
jgi:hypothetical protein